MAIITLAQILFLLILIGGIVLVAWRGYEFVDGVFSSRSRTVDAHARHAPPLRKGIPVFVIGLLGFFWWGAAEYISPTEIGVVENQTNGSLTTIDRGLHVWPFDSRVAPVITKTTKYSFSSKSDGDNSLTLGDKDDLTKRIASASTSEGQPVVYFWVKLVAVPNREHILTLHRRYGRGYLQGYVSNNFESAVKTIQGKNEFDYLTDNRSKFETEVAEELNRRLAIETVDKVPLVSIVFVNVLDFDYSPDVNAQLNRIVSANNTAEAAKAEANSVREKANGDKDAVIAKAEGDRQAAQLAADALLYQKQKEAEGITAVQQALASSPTYTQLQQVQKWNGVLPTFMGGDSPIPFFNLPSTTAPAAR
jgi:regulator of protease activity HflC (stomatin/prohibitin superfamily)